VQLDVDLLDERSQWKKVPIVYVAVLVCPCLFEPLLPTFLLCDSSSTTKSPSSDLLARSSADFCRETKEMDIRIRKVARNHPENS